MPKLISEDENFFNVMRDDGQAFKVAKKGIDQGRMGYFSGLPKYDPNPTPEPASSVNAQNVAMTESVEPKTGVVVPSEYEMMTPDISDTPRVADLGGDVTVGKVNPDPTSEVDLSNFAIPNQQEGSESTSSASPMDNYAQSLRESASVEGAGQKKQADALDQALNESREIATDFDSQEKQLEREKLQAEKTYKEVSEDYFNSKEIDQDRYWDNMSTGRKIMAGIGLALASLNPQSMQTALASINRNIDRDIQAQKLEIMKKKEKVAEAKGLVGEFYKKFKDLDQAENAAKMSALEKAKLKMQSIQLNTQNELVKKKAETAISQIEMQLLQEKQKFDQKVKERTVNIGRFQGEVENKTEAKEFRNTLSDLETAEQGIDRLLEINEMTGKSLSPTLRSEAQTIQQTLVGLLRRPITGPGAMSDGEREMLKDMIANPTDLLSLDMNNKTKLQTLKKTLRNAVNTKAKNLGLTTDADKIGFKKK